MTSRTEEEQLADIKDWLRRNGSPLLTGAALALVVVFGWQTWGRYKTNQAETASSIYQTLLESSLTPNGKPDQVKVMELANKLSTEYAGTAYAQYSRLFVAKLAVESGKLDAAAAELKAVMDKPFDTTLGELARQRLARVMAAQGKAQEALTLLDAEVDKAFLAEREELRGDLLLSLKREDEARTAYEKAKAALPEEAAAGVLQMKLDDLAKGGA